MSDNAPVQPIAEVIERSLGIGHVYGDPIVQGEKTVIPIAQVAYAFGAGGGGAHAGAETAAEAGPRARPRAFGSGSGGGGAVKMSPLGVLEIGPSGVRFIRFRPAAPLLAAVALGFAAGWLLGRRAG